MYYITVEELNNLMPSIFSSKDLNRIDWINIDEMDKQVYINKAEGIIDTMRYKGTYVEENQPHAFPRVIQRKTVTEKDASLKLAITCIIYDFLSFECNERVQLIRQGVKSISTGGVSESYADEVKEVTENYRVYLKKYLFSGVL